MKGVAGLLIVPLLTLCLALWLANGRIARLTQSLLHAQTDNRLLEGINAQQADTLSIATRDQAALRALLGRQAAQLATLDDTTRSTTHALQRALATPPAGYLDCAREPLPDDAVRLLQSAATHSDTTGQGAAAGELDAGVPGT